MNSRANNIREGCPGFSMIEMAIALAVVAVGVITLLGILSLSLTGSKESVSDSLMALKAKEIMERAEKASSLNLIQVGPDPDLVLTLTNDATSPFYLYMDVSGNAFTNYTGPNRPPRTSLQAIMTLSTNIYVSNGVITTASGSGNLYLQATNVALLKVDMVAPSIGATQTFQTFLMK